MEADFAPAVEQALKALREGKVLLVPSDEGWSLGCDATEEIGIGKIKSLLQIAESTSLSVLVADERDVLQYVSAPDLAVFSFLEEQDRPTTVIYDGAINLPDSLITHNGRVAIRMVQDPFCRHLIRRLRRPIAASTVKGNEQFSPCIFRHIPEELKAQVDHLVSWRQEESEAFGVPQVIWWKDDGTYEIISK